MPVGGILQWNGAYAFVFTQLKSFPTHTTLLLAELYDVRSRIMNKIEIAISLFFSNRFGND